MTEQAADLLTPAQRATFASLADVLLPASEGMPSATEVAAEGMWLDRALRARPDLQLELIQVLQTIERRDPIEALRFLEATDEAGFDTLLILAASAYYMSPRVRKLVRYPGQERRPIYLDGADHYLGDGLLDFVSAPGAGISPRR